MRGLKYNIKEELMHYRGKLNSLNFFIKAAIKFDYKFYKLAIETGDSNPNSKVGPYLKHTSYGSKEPKINR